jgi:hypothetical protein
MQYTKTSSGFMWDPTDLRYFGSTVKLKLYMVSGSLHSIAGNTIVLFIFLMAQNKWVKGLM